MPRKKPKPSDREALDNERELDRAAGVPVVDIPRANLPPVPEGDVRPPINHSPLVKGDTREKLLYKIAHTGLPFGDEFFDNFPDASEVAKLSLSIGIRQLSLMVCNPDFSKTTERISALRVLIKLVLGEDDPDDPQADGKTAPIPPKIPTSGMADVASTLDKIRRLSKG